MLGLAVIASVPSVSAGQVDGSWVGPSVFVNEPVYAPLPGPVNVLNQGHNWTDPNWSSLTFPSQSGSAVIGRPGVLDPFDRQSRLIITLDTDVSLREISLANPDGIDITDTQPAINARFVTSAQGLVIRGDHAPAEAPSRYSVVNAMNNIDVPIVGSGTLLITGPAPVTLGRANSFTGTMSASSGIVSITNRNGTADYDQRFGASAASVQLESSTLRLTHYGATSSPQAVLTRDFALSGNGATIAVNAALPADFRGVLSGPGSLRLEGDSIRLTAINSYVGNTVISGRGMILEGSIAQSAAIESTGMLLLSRAASSPNLDRIGDTTPVTLHGGMLAITTAEASPTAETLGALSAAGAVSAIRFSGTTAPMTLNVASIHRSDRGGLFIDGANIGGGANALLLGNGPSLLTGGGGTAGTASQSVIPWMWAYLGNAGTASNGSGKGSLVTYSANGVRPLDFSTEYAQSFAAAGQTDNVRVTASQSVTSAGKRVNALLLGSSNNSDTGAPSTLSGGTITVTSGAILNTTRGNVVFNPIRFEGTEGVIISTSTPGANGDQGLTLWGAISGTQGITKIGPGNLLLAGANTYTGQTTIAGGRLTIIDDVLPNTPGPLGQSNDAIVMFAGGMLPGSSDAGSMTRLVAQRAGGSLTINRPIIVRGQTHATAVGASLENASDTGSLNIAGPVTLESAQAPLGVQRGEIVFWNSFTGPGRVRDTGDAAITFAAPSPSWTGGLELGLTGAAATLNLAAPAALGTGPVFVAGESHNLIRATGGPRTLGNDLIFAAAKGDSVLRFEGELTVTGAIDLGGNVGRPIAVAAGSQLRIESSLKDGSLRLLAGAFGSTVTAGGTLTLAAATQLDGRIFLGAPAYANGTPATAGGTLRIMHSGALGNAGVQFDGPNSMLELNAGESPSGSLVVRSGNLFLMGTGVDNRGAIFSAIGQNTITGNVALLDDTAVGVSAGTTLRLTGEIDDLSINHTSVLTKIGGGTLVAPQLASRPLQGLAVSDGTLAMAGGANSAGVLKSLVVSPTATLDVANRTIAVDYTGNSPLAQLTALIATGRNGGVWNGRGIISSIAQSDARTSLAIAELSQLSALPAGLELLPTDANTVVMTYTLAADADLNGKVDLDDFVRLAAGFGKSGTWTTGDFDYDGSTTLADFTALAVNFGLSRPAVASRASVPEPGVLPVAMAVAGLMRRRGRR